MFNSKKTPNRNSNKKTESNLNWVRKTEIKNPEKSNHRVAEKESRAGWWCVLSFWEDDLNSKEKRG